MTKDTGGQRPTKTRPKKVATVSRHSTSAALMPVRLTAVPAGYGEWLTDLKERIHAAQERAALAVNRELLTLHWQLGRDILDRQERAGWGAGIVDRVSADLRAAFPAMRGFSRANLMYMRAFAEAWPEVGAIVQEPVGQLPWGHNLVLLTKLKTREGRLAYASHALEHGWSRAVLVHHIEMRTVERQGKALMNFAERLPKPQSDLARETPKDPSIFATISVLNFSEYAVISARSLAPLHVTSDHPATSLTQGANEGVAVEGETQGRRAMTRAGRKAEVAGRGTVPSTSSTRVGFASPHEPPHPEDHALTARGSAGGPPDSRSRFSRSSAYSSSLTGRTLSAIVSRNQSSRSRMTALDDSFSGGFCSSSRRASSSFRNAHGLRYPGCNTS